MDIEETLDSCLIQNRAIHIPLQHARECRYRYRISAQSDARRIQAHAGRASHYSPWRSRARVWICRSLILGWRHLSGFRDEQLVYGQFPSFAVHYKVESFREQRLQHQVHSLL
jgi:hypothetical protein